MRYVHEPISEFITLERGEYLYDPDDVEFCDVLDARYHHLNRNDSNRAISCLPVPLDWHDLCMEDQISAPYYDPDIVSGLLLSERYQELARFKTTFRVPLGFYAILEQRVNEGLISAYQGRKIGFQTRIGKSGEITEECCSVAPDIASSVQCVSLIGTAGSGKSTAIQRMLRRYPRAIRHKLEDGTVFTQIPFLLTTAYEGRDIKSIYINLAQYIDRVTDEHDFHAHEMARCSSAAKMEGYLATLIRQYHVGMIIIDEIQLMKKGSVFNNLLSVMQMTSVSICVIGTEEAWEMIRKDLWANRRFGHRGLVRTDATENDDTLFVNLIKKMWTYQYTKEKYTLTPRIISTLKEVTAYNVDFLTTVFTMAQCMVLQSQGALKLDELTIRKAASAFPGTTKMIVHGKKVSDSVFVNEQKVLSQTMQTAKEKAEEEEKKRFLEQMPVLHQKKEDMLRDVINRINGISEHPVEEIRRAYERLNRKNKEFSGFEARDKASLVLQELATKEKKPKRLSPVSSGISKEKETKVVSSMMEGLLGNMTKR